MTSNHLDEPLSVGILGAGKIAAEVHIPVLLATRGARVAWVVDRDEAKAREVAKSFGVAHAPMPKSPLDLARVDAVLMAIPFGVRAPYYAAFATIGAAIYVEKPFARTLAEHDAQCALFAKERVAVGYQKRSAGYARALAEIVRTELFGPLLSMRVEYGRPGVSTAGRYSSDLAMAGGGILFEVGVHPIDLALFVSGATAAEVTSGRMLRELGFDLHTEASARLTTTRGEVTLDMLVTNLQHTTSDVTLTFERASIAVNIWGDGALRVTSRDGAFEAALGGSAWELPKTAAQHVHAHWTAFLAGIREREENLTCASTTRVTTELLEQLYALGE